ncbi:MAG: hypothetical protein KJ726_10585, partial [Verrucomicrobia bacterium]|nr:hypothetical protein [Verrucomicrobiota bacterium]
LATDPPAGADPAEAIRLALRAKDLCTVIYPGILDTLAVAYAAHGEFERAMYWSRQAHDLAVSNGLERLASKIGERTRVYQEGKAWGKTGAVERLR